MSIREPWDMRLRTLVLVILIALSFRSPSWNWLHAARNPDLNRSDLEAGAGGYYVAVIDGGESAGARGMSDLNAMLIGKPPKMVKFMDAGVSVVHKTTFLQSRLLPNLNVPLFGAAFTTNALGLRDREYSLEKPPGVFRIALLGSSMDMGWGVGTEQTYENLWEDRLNAHGAASDRKLRYEVLNYAVAADSPEQRLERFMSEALALQPDMVVYSATMLDPRLAEIHLRSMLLMKTDMKYPFLRDAVIRSGLTAEELTVGADGDFTDKKVVKAKIQTIVWDVLAESLRTLSATCREKKIPLAVLLIPRAGAADKPELRAEMMERYLSVVRSLHLPCINLMATFDRKNPAGLAIAPWDDHPNAAGHRLLFSELNSAFETDPQLASMLRSSGSESGSVSLSETGIKIKGQ